MSTKSRSSAEEIQGSIDSLMAEADALQAKETLSPEEQSHLDEVLSQIEQLQSDLAAAQSSQRLLAAKNRMQQPTRPAPKVAATPKRNDRDEFSEGLRLWMLSRTAEPDHSSEAHFRTREAGFMLGSGSAKIKCDYRGLNFKQRTILTKGGSGSGAEWIYKSYSDHVTEYLTYFSPFVGTLATETTGDGNARDYFRIDDTGLKSTYLTASAGTDSNPTIPDTNIASAAVTINTFDLTSGYQKISYQELRDAHAAVGIVEKIAKANSNSHARKLEDEILNASGNGSTGVQGLFAVDNVLTPVTSSNFNSDAQSYLEDMYFRIPMQYRQNAMWLYNDVTAKRLRKYLKDADKRSLFDKNIVDGVEWDTLLGKRAYVSQYMADDVILFFVPDFYMLRMVEGQRFDTLVEKYHPHTAYCGLMSFGGAWLGPTGASGAVHSLTITS
ncbi:phage major capsid protein [Gemmata sp. G18]|uniref:Phage major capsid protein n=1 Tax=Gemmata palustris TaxID=2822762 RepID=A0ABS5BUM7_9BACT|nr:phage major capsid protein [Gemmata palustris]MBP3957419.1 phage major capsid protein [Gemmata palustris]